MIRIVNLMFGLQNVDQMASHPVYNFKKICKPDGRHPVQFFNLFFELFKY